MVDFSHQLIALIQQIIGGLPIALGSGNFVVDRCHTGRQRIDGGDFLVEFDFHALLQIVHIGRSTAHAAGCFVGLGQCDGARGQVGRCASYV
ncbi:MAG: hypothetical protein FD135_2599 [Comamonadaceae bacterium]|nr:MAG: hypothetical protein FD135_2599 [Comamonadaceae bacterium]